MDTPDLSPQLLEAGAGYLSALDRLGLKPEGLLWVYDFEEAKHVLWVIWTGVDKLGPLDIQKRLFAAYRASALPRVIDPFIVYVLSPRSNIVRNVARTLGYPGMGEFQIGTDKFASNDFATLFEGRADWTYRFEKKSRTAVEISRHWRRFDAAVTALAA